MKGKQGFASISVERRREIASMGGKAAHAAGTAHQYTSEEARAAGRKGGRKAHATKKAHQFTSASGSEAGKKGAIARKQRSD